MRECVVCVRYVKRGSVYKGVCRGSVYKGVCRGSVYKGVVCLQVVCREGVSKGCVRECV